MTWPWRGMINCQLSRNEKNKEQDHYFLQIGTEEKKENIIIYLNYLFIYIYFFLKKIANVNG